MHACLCNCTHLLELLVGLSPTRHFPGTGSSFDFLASFVSTLHEKVKNREIEMKPNQTYDNSPELCTMSYKAVAHAHHYIVLFNTVNLEL